ncbi:MAG: hypothetical protein K2X77_00310 [Candidatus Obscuribacterales bacterium]|nr:hypothetical protein [Candidatus Obscuribacterales bacterium]
MFDGRGILLAKRQPRIEAGKMPALPDRAVRNDRQEIEAGKMPALPDRTVRNDRQEIEAGKMPALPERTELALLALSEDRFV